MRTHKLKTTKRYFEAVLNGSKTAEFRQDDRDFKVGDRLILQETTACYYTGREVSASITHILRNFAGIENGYAMLSIHVQRGTGRKVSLKRRIAKEPA